MRSNLLLIKLYLFNTHITFKTDIHLKSRSSQVQYIMVHKVLKIGVIIRVFIIIHYLNLKD